MEVGARADARDKTVVRITVTNRGRHTCAVDRTPTVTCGDLDAAAQHAPPGAGGLPVLPPGCCRRGGT
nr:DUF4232 domain-containing protein [Streptomyces albidoflavus]